MRLLRTVGLAVLAIASGVSLARADDDAAKEFRTARRSIQQRMRHKKPEVRVAAVRRLGEFPLVEAAKLLVEQGFSNPQEDVRKASFETLLTFNGNEEICRALLDLATKDAKRSAPTESNCLLWAMLLTAESNEVERKLLEFLTKAADNPRGGLLLLVSIADVLGQLKDTQGLSALVKFSKSPLFAEHFAVRRAVILAMTGIEEPQTVDALIAMLPEVKGEVRSDIVGYLKGISGEDFGLDAPKWQAWWQANRESFQFPPEAQRKAAKRVAAENASMAYYGIPIYAQRLVFVIDTSYSMRGERIAAAKRELVKAIEGLPSGVYFGVLAFDRAVKPWRRELVEATSKAKQQATTFVQLLDLGGATASYDALEASLDFDTEAVYFLTDGAPHGGKVQSPPEIVEVITRLNRARRVTINSIGIHVGEEGSPFDTFLSTLAEKNFGEYRRVE